MKCNFRWTRNVKKNSSILDFAKIELIDKKVISTAAGIFLYRKAPSIVSMWMIWGKKYRTIPCFMGKSHVLSQPTDCFNVDDWKQMQMAGTPVDQALIVPCFPATCPLNPTEIYWQQRIPSGNDEHRCGKSQFLLGKSMKSTISMGISNSKLSLQEGSCCSHRHFGTCEFT